MSRGVLGIITLGILIMTDQITGQGCIIKPPLGCYTAEDYDYNGYSVMNKGPKYRMADSWQHCKQKCDNFGTICKYWTFRAKDKHCWLKTKDALSGERYVQGQTLISGNANCRSIPGVIDKLDAMKAAYKSIDVTIVSQLCMYWMTVTNYLPKLMEANKMEEGDIGVDDGKYHQTNKVWVKTLSLLTGTGIITSRTMNQMVTINGTVNGYIGKRYYGKARSSSGPDYGSIRERPTGLYAGPGDIVTITIPQRLVGKLEAKIGHIKLMLYFTLTKTVNQIGSPWGGHIIIYLLDKDATKGELNITVDNAIKAPSFVYLKDNNEEWNNKIKKYSPKWAVLSIPGQLDVYIQTLKIKQVTDMEGTLAKWKSTMDLLEEMLGLPPNSKPGPERLVFNPGQGGGYHDVKCGPGLAVGGDALYTQSQKTDTYTYYNDFIYGPGTNGLVLHEFGHGFCYNDLPDMGEQWTAETVRSYIEFKKGVNPAEPLDMDFSLLSRMVGFALYSNGKPCGEATFKTIQLKTSRYDRCQRWLNYIPIKEFGWDTLRKVFSMDAVSKKVYNSNWDRMVDLYCHATQHNLIPLFKFYNVNVPETISESCEKQPNPQVITEYLNIANCVKKSMESTGKRDMKVCAKLPRFPAHKGLCMFTGVCHNDKAYGTEMKMISKFDLYGSTGKWMSNQDTANNKQNCLNQALAKFQDCNNSVKQKNHAITATFHASAPGEDASYTFPPEDECYTVEGDQPKAVCEFPFRYNGKKYKGCTKVGASKPWCATAVDGSGTYISGKWGYCWPGCKKGGRAGG